MQNIRLSIIIPFYNVEKYIAQCLDSVYAQDIPESEYEVICVNDCSPDCSRDTVLRTQHSHSNLILIEHEKNKMLGAARNTGLRAARGKYVWFIDSDDYIKENCLGKLLEIAERNELEILHFNAWQITDEGKQTEWEVNFPYNTNVITGIDYLNIDYPYWKKHGSTWSKIFLNDFLKKNNLFFPESVFFEDGVHSLNSILLASRFLFDTSCIYFYRINENSITSFKNLINNGVKMADRVYCCCACMDLLEKYKKHPFAYNVREVYIYLPLSLKKSVLYLPLREKLIFYKKINSFDRTILWKYMRLIEHFVYTYPLIMIVLSILPISILRPIRTLKRKIMNSDK